MQTCLLASAVCKKELHKQVLAAVLRDYDVSACLDQTIPLPGVDAAPSDLIAGHSDSHAAGPLYFLNLHKPVAEAEQFLAAEIMVEQDALDDHPFRKVLVIVERSIDAFAKIGRQAKQFNFAANIFQIGPARQVESKAAPAQVFEQCMASGDGPVRGSCRACFQGRQPDADPLPQEVVVAMFV